MPDLTTHAAYACNTNREWSTTVLSSDGTTEYTVRWGRLYHPRRSTDYGYTCTCPGYEHRHTCRHVRELEATDIEDHDKDLSKHRCGWDARWEAGEPVSVPGCGEFDKACPVCGVPVYA